MITNFSRNYSVQKKSPQNHFTLDSERERETCATQGYPSNSLFQNRLNSLSANDLIHRSTFNNFTYKGEPLVFEQRHKADQIASSLLN